MTVADLIAGLQVMPTGVIILGCNKGILEMQYKGARLTLSLEVIGHRTGAAEAYVRSAFVDAEEYAKGLR